MAYVVPASLTDLLRMSNLTALHVAQHIVESGDSPSLRV